METYNDLAKEIHQNAIEHGWWEKERGYPELVALMHSELSEALEAYRDSAKMVMVSHGKPEGIAVELADCVIRILDYCGRQGIDMDEALAACNADDAACTLPELVADCHARLSLSHIASTDKLMRGRMLAECTRRIRSWCAANQIDMEGIIQLKQAYNRTRPYRHGGKVC